MRPDTQVECKLNCGQRSIWPTVFLPTFAISIVAGLATGTRLSQVAAAGLGFSIIMVIYIYIFSYEKVIVWINGIEMRSLEDSAFVPWDDIDCVYIKSILWTKHYIIESYGRNLALAIPFHYKGKASITDTIGTVLGHEGNAYILFSSTINKNC